MDHPLAARPGRVIAARRRVALALAALLAAQAPAAARAGPIGDAIATVGGWVTQVEDALLAWAGDLWRRAVGRNDAETTATAALRDLALRSPAVVYELAAQVGFRFTGYRVEQGPMPSAVVLSFTHLGDMTDQQRLELLRRLDRENRPETQARRALVQLLLDGADVRRTANGDGFRFTGLELRLAGRADIVLLFSLGQPSV